VKSVNGLTGAISIAPGVNITVQADGTAVTVGSVLELPDQTGNSARVLGTDGTNPSWFSVVAGSNVTINRNTNAKFIQISASGGGGTGGGGGTAIWPALIFGG
jgi:hypothetical protein